MTWTSPRTWVDGELVTSALLNTHIRDDLSDLRASTDWTPVVYLNGWSDAIMPMLYKRTGSWVTLCGTMHNGTINGSAAAFQMPSGFVPPRNLMFVSWSEDSIATNEKAMIEIQISTGYVVPEYGSNYFFGIACTYSLL